MPDTSVLTEACSSEVCRPAWLRGKTGFTTLQSWCQELGGCRLCEMGGVICPDGETGVQMGSVSSSRLPGKSRAALGMEPTTVLTMVPSRVADLPGGLFRASRSVPISWSSLEAGGVRPGGWAMVCSTPETTGSLKADWVSPPSTCGVLRSALGGASLPR